MNEPVVTVVGNLVADPEMRFTQSGVPVSNLTIAQTPRSFDRDTESWEDGQTLFMRCSVFGQTAEHAVESLHKGHHVIAVGRLQQRDWETAEGERRTVVELAIDEIGASLRFADVDVRKVERRSNEKGNGDSGNRRRGGR